MFLGGPQTPVSMVGTFPQMLLEMGTASLWLLHFPFLWPKPGLSVSGPFYVKLNAKIGGGGGARAGGHFLGKERVVMTMKSLKTTDL